MADTVEVQILADTYQRTAVKLVNVSDGTGESNVLKVNAAALAGAMSILTIDADPTLTNFKIGETITAESGGTAIVADVLNGARTSWAIINANGTFADNDTITGSESAAERVQSGALTAANYRFHIARIAFCVVSGSTRLVWQGNGGGANNRIAATLSGTGEWELPGAAITNNANNATGNLLVTTNDFIAGTANSEQQSSYTIVLELKKTDGYVKPSPERNAFVHHPSSGLS